jgi:hypothetical protein
VKVEVSANGLPMNMPTPDVMFVFSAKVICDTNASALA